MSFSATTYPYETVVYITDTIGTQDWQGSGVLIAPDEVLTASHVVYTQGVGSANDIEVVPAYGAGSEPYGSATGTEIHYFQIDDAGKLITTEQSQYDYAVSHLSTSFTSLGTMGLESNFEGGMVNVTGYPASSDGLMVNSQQVVEKNPSYTVLDGTSIGDGSSGGPVWITGSNGGPYVVGLVSSGTEDAAGTFVQITTAAFNQIEAWAADGAACFGAGTHILTATGEVAVESLRVGDAVATVRGGKLAKIKWLGHRHVVCRRHSDARAVWPIRVRAGAFGVATPHADLRLSPDHAVFIDGALIPVRYLVNGRSIVQEPRDQVTYWHVELPAHGILLAEGLAVESYLDTGNRGAFADNSGPTALHADFSLCIWATEACAPLVLNGAKLRAARGQLLDRAALLGYAITGDAALRLLVDGFELRPTTIDGFFRFRLPADARSVRLLSRSTTPAHTSDDGHDERCLGVAVSRMVLNGQQIALDDPRLGSGWHEVEHGGVGLPAWRWTNGDAALALAGAVELDLEVAMTERYWAEPLPAIAMAAATLLG